MDQDREESDKLRQLPALELLQAPFAFLRTEMRHSVLPPPTVKLLQPALDKHRKECIEQNEYEAEEEQHVHCGGVGGDLKACGLKSRGGRVAELLGNVNEHVHCDVAAVGLELWNQEDKEGGKEGRK